MANLGRVNREEALILLHSVCSSYLSSGKGDKAEGLARAARGVEEFAPEDALGVLELLDPFEPGYRSQVLSAVARTWAHQGSHGARELLDRSIAEAELADSEWLRVEALFCIAEDSADWDATTSLRLIERAVGVARSFRGPVLLGHELAVATRLMIALGDEQGGRSFLLEACDTLKGPSPDKFELEAILETCQQSSNELVGSITARLVRALTEASFFSPTSCPLQEWLHEILPLFLRVTESDRLPTAIRLLQEIDLSKQLVDRIFLG